MTVRGHEVEAAVHSVVLYVSPVESRLVLEVFIELLVHVSFHALPVVPAVDTVTEPCQSGHATQYDVYTWYDHYWLSFQDTSLSSI